METTEDLVRELVAALTRRFEDHDMLVEIRASMVGVLATLREIQETNKNRHEDHEDRIRLLESDKGTRKGFERGVTIVVSTLLSSGGVWLLTRLFH